MLSTQKGERPLEDHCHRGLIAFSPSIVTGSLLFLKMPFVSVLCFSIPMATVRAQVPLNLLAGFLLLVGLPAPVLPTDAAEALILNKSSIVA